MPQGSSCVAYEARSSGAFPAPWLIDCYPTCNGGDRDRMKVQSPPAAQDCWFPQSLTYLETTKWSKIYHSRKGKHTYRFVSAVGTLMRSERVTPDICNQKMVSGVLGLLALLGGFTLGLCHGSLNWTNRQVYAPPVQLTQSTVVSPLASAVQELKTAWVGQYRRFFRET